jgi:hypothetical protein
MKTNRFIFWTINFVIMVTLIGCVCESNEDQQTAQNKQSAKYVWPPPASKDEAVSLAPNLLTNNFMLIMDFSGSMAERGCSGNLSKAEAAKNAIAEYLKIVPEDANLGLIIFDGRGIHEYVQLGTNNRQKILQQVNAGSPDNGTPLLDAITLGKTSLEIQAQHQLGYGQYHLVIVTDGEATPSCQDPTSVINNILKNPRNPINIRTIGFCIGNDHPLNQKGKTNYATAQNPQELINGLKAVQAESEQYQ